MTSPAADKAIHDLLCRSSRAAQPILQVMREQGEAVRIILHPEGLDLMLPMHALQGGPLTDAIERQVKGLPIRIYGMEATAPCSQ